ncbi:MAG: class I SAM-dependent methyltransferase [Phycisphaerales bacterium]|nr:class I SAM-dependent methyltransferase [Phycisphaerales bacterium]
MMPAPPTLCPACGNQPADWLRLRCGETLLRCPGCELAWWRWHEFDAAAFYDRDYFQSETAAKGYADYRSLERGTRRTARARLSRIDSLRARFASRLLERGDTRPRLLEIGCGTGCFLDEAARAGWDADGIEISEYAAAEAASRGQSVVCGSLEDVDLPASEYDCVAMWDVIEHLPDPHEAIAAAARTLRSGGVLALSTGDVTSACARWTGTRWHLFNLPEHLFFFSPKSLELILARQRCRVVERVNEVNWSPVAYLVERVAKTIGLPASLARPLRILPGVVPATLFDVMGLYAIKA